MCAWVYEFDKFYNYVKVIPQKLNLFEKGEIINIITN